MIVLTYPACKASGQPNGKTWYIASEFQDGAFTLTLNRSNALQFATEAAADAFNQRHMQRGQLTNPFKIQEL